MRIAGTYFLSRVSIVVVRLSCCMISFVIPKKGCSASIFLRIFTHWPYILSAFGMAVIIFWMRSDAAAKCGTAPFQVKAMVITRQAPRACCLYSGLVGSRRTRTPAAPQANPSDTKSSHLRPWYELT